MLNLNRKHDMAERVLFILICVGILCFLTAFVVLNASEARYFNSDSFADCQVAKRMWEQKTLFPQGWAFGNQYYVIATPVLAAILYGLVGEIHTAMMLATGIMVILILVSFVWLLRSFTKRRLDIGFAVLLLLVSVISPWGPHSLYYFFFFGQASFYACYLITLFVVFGDYIRAMESSEKRWAAWVLALLLCFATGMQSLRQTVIMVLPILVYELLRVLRSLLRREKVWNREDRGRLVRAVSYAAANGAGVCFIKVLKVSQTSIYGEMESVLPEEFPKRIEEAVEAVMEITNIGYVLYDNSSRSISLMILFFLAAAGGAAVLWLSHMLRQETGLEACWLLYLIGIGGVLLATILLNITIRDVYIFMWFPFAVLSAMIILEKLPHLIKYGAIIVVCAFALLCFKSSYIPYMRYAVTEMPSAEKQMCQWVTDNGYEYIYGEYWSTAPRIAIYAAGDVEIGCWHKPGNVFQVEGVNTPQDIYGEEENRKAVYIFTDSDEEEGLRAAKERNAELTKVAEFGDYRAYTSPVPLMKVAKGS